MGLFLRVCSECMCECQSVCVCAEGVCAEGVCVFRVCACVQSVCVSGCGGCLRVMRAGVSERGRVWAVQ